MLFIQTRCQMASICGAYQWQMGPEELPKGPRIQLWAPAGQPDSSSPAFQRIRDPLRTEPRSVAFKLYILIDLTFVSLSMSNSFNY